MSVIIFSPKKKVEFLQRNSFYISNVEIEGNEKYTRAYVLGKLKLKVPAEVTYVAVSCCHSPKSLGEIQPSQANPCMLVRTQPSLRVAIT